jgi:hypothetical protein
MMRLNNLRGDGISSWLESQYCASVAATLLARTEYFELLEDAMVSPAKLARAWSSWRDCESNTNVLGGLVTQA